MLGYTNKSISEPTDPLRERVELIVPEYDSHWTYDGLGEWVRVTPTGAVHDAILTLIRAECARELRSLIAYKKPWEWKLEAERRAEKLEAP